MFEKEERMLGEMKNATERARTMVADEALESAVRSGIRGGKRRRKRLYGLKAASFATAAAAAVLLLAALWSGGSGLAPKEQLAQGPYPQLTGFDIDGDITASTANRHGLIQPVNQSESLGDYTVTVNGVLAGSQQLYVFYTVENRSDAKAVVLREVLKEPGSGDELAYGSSGSGDPMLETGTTTRRVSYYFDDSNPIPSSVSIEVALAPYSTKTMYATKSPDEKVMEFELKLDPETTKQFTRTVPLNRTVHAQGQTLWLKEAVLSPGGIAVKANVPKDNKMKVSGLSQPYIESSKEGAAPVKLGNPLTWKPDEKGNTTYFFDSNALDEPDALVLKAEGLQAVNREDMKIVVDVKQGKVLSSPDDIIRFGAYSNTEDGGNQLTLVYEEDHDRYKGTVSIDTLQFTDGEGNRHTFHETEGSRTRAETSTGEGYRRTTLFLYLKQEDYPQPLTFDVDSFPGVIEQAIEVPIQ